MSQAELRVAEDVWMQMLALLALISGGFTAVRYLPLQRPLTREEPGAPAPALLEGEAPGQAPKSGPWVVDAAGGAGSHYTSLAAAAAAAKAGDSILLRPGEYPGEATISRPLIISGGGSGASQVRLSHSGERTLVISAGRVYLTGVTVANSGGAAGTAIEVTGGALVLERVTAEASGDAVAVREGAELEASRASLRGRVGVSVQGRAKASLLDTTVAARAAGLLVDGMAEVRVEGSRLKASDGPAVDAAQFAKVRMTDVSLTDCGAEAVRARSGAEVRLTRSKLALNRGCGATVDGASLFAERVRFSSQRCGVGFLGPGRLETVDSEYVDLELGPLAIKPGRERDVTIRGSGNTGLKIP